MRGSTARVPGQRASRLPPSPSDPQTPPVTKQLWGPNHLAPRGCCLPEHWVQPQQTARPGGHCPPRGWSQTPECRSHPKPALKPALWAAPARRPGQGSALPGRRLTGTSGQGRADGARPRRAGLPLGATPAACGTETRARGRSTVAGWGPRPTRSPRPGRWRQTRARGRSTAAGNGPFRKHDPLWEQRPLRRAQGAAPWPGCFPPGGGWYWASAGSAEPPAHPGRACPAARECPRTAAIPHNPI